MNLGNCAPGSVKLAGTKNEPERILNMTPLRADVA